MNTTNRFIITGIIVEIILINSINGNLAAIASTLLALWFLWLPHFEQK